MRKKSAYIIAILIVVALAIILLGANFFTEILWFKSTGYLKVFLTTLISRWAVRILSGLAFFIFLYINLIIAGKNISDFHSFQFQQSIVNNPLYQMLTPRWIKTFFFIVSLVMAVIFTAVTSSHWLTVISFFHANPFGIKDPLFNKDISFYIFNLPFLEVLYNLLAVMIALTLIIVATLYMLSSFNKGFLAWIQVLSRQTQVIALLALVIVLRACGYIFSMYHLLYSPRGVTFGASFVDAHAVLPGLKVMALLSLILSVTLVANLKMKRTKIIYWVLGVMIAASILLQGVYPGLVQQFQVAPNEFAKEEPFIRYNIDFTLKGYGLDKVARKEFAVSDTLNPAEIMGSPTVETLRLWDYRPIQQTYNQLQRIRPYYNFAQVDIDRYTINGELRQVMLSARELDQNRLDERAKTWVNKRLQYTHGFGAVMSPVNAMTSEGLPEFFIKNMPPISTEDDLKIKEPRIYFGELTDEYVVVNSKTEEFDYPSGETNVYNKYDGSGGIPLNLWSRLLFSIRLGDYKLLVSDNFEAESRIMFDRNITTMVGKIAPFIKWDQDPYLVIAQGKMYWIIDGYTVTNRFPYSEPVENINYIRNSVKAVIDAYNGDVKFYITDDNDPIIKAYGSIFDDMFIPLKQMPREIREHIRYPEDMFLIQAKIYSLYHMDDTKVFYNKEDAWQIPDEIYGSQRQKMQPYYTILQLPGESKPEQVLMLPFTPSTIENMRAWMAARCDGENYGEIILYLFPKDKTVYGPMQIEARINQDSVISEQLTLWDQRGSNVILGNLLVLPIENTILYVRPVFLQGEQSQLPELSRVIVAYGEHVVMKETLEEAFTSVFGETQQEKPPNEKTTHTAEEEKTPTGFPQSQDMIKRAAQLYNEAINAQRQGDWATYGQKINELGDILNKLSDEQPQ